MRHDSYWEDEAAAWRLRCGARLRAAREAAGLSGRELGRQAGIPNTSSVSAYEMGHTTPSPARMIALARCLGVEPDDIWSFGDAGR